MKYHIWTIGCQMNIADSQRLASELEQLGYSWSDVPDDADVIVLNTCVVRQQAEDKVYGRLGSLKPIKAARPETVVGLMGCLVGHHPAKGIEKRFPHVDVFLSPSDTSPLVDLLRRRRGASRGGDALAADATSDADGRPLWSAARSLDLAARSLDADTTEERHQLQDAVLDGPLVLPAGERGKLVAAHVPIVLGCSWVCAYCIIPSRRGPERSKPARVVREHVASLVDQGVREVTLLGQIVDRYGHDRGEVDALPDLLESLSEIEGLLRIRFLTSHPNYMTDRLLRTVAEQPKVMEHLEVPVQAGHDEVLQRMKRGYTVEEYRRLVHRIRDTIPGVAIHTDVIVGFPGESGDQFDATLELLDELRLEKAHIAKFSPRPGTIAALSMMDDVPADEKERRRKALDVLQTAINEAKNRELLGQTVEVLVEGNDRGRWRSRTRTNKIVYFEDDRQLLGRMDSVSIDWAGPWSMIGHSASKTLPDAERPGGSVDPIYTPD